MWCMQEAQLLVPEGAVCAGKYDILSNSETIENEERHERLPVYPGSEWLQELYPRMLWHAQLFQFLNTRISQSLAYFAFTSHSI